jgi:hypothetical protein
MFGACSSQADDQVAGSGLRECFLLRDDPMSDRSEDPLDRALAKQASFSASAWPLLPSLRPKSLVFGNLPSAFAQPVEFTENPVLQAIRYVGRLLNDVITSALPTIASESDNRASSPSPPTLDLVRDG